MRRVLVLGRGPSMSWLACLDNAWGLKHQGFQYTEQAGRLMARTIRRQLSGGPQCAELLRTAIVVERQVIALTFASVADRRTGVLLLRNLPLLQYGDKSDVMGNDGSAAQGYLCTNVCNQFRYGTRVLCIILTVVYQINQMK